MMTSEESDPLSTAPSDGHAEEMSASGTEEAPSSMVSSEAESEGSILSEPARAEHAEHAMSRSCDGVLPEHQATADKPPAPVPSDWRSVGNTVSSLVSTRGKSLRSINILYL
ncbi:uncharacterized protein LOC134679387 [Cydia fagiglandana]|uniref:uncharacterized protein LOC134679387 n=1 Tax=Cydia fagiglandana TaxID=1458189 RepID=UPI002FEE40FA